MTDDEPMVFSPAREHRVLSFLNLDGSRAMQICAERGLLASMFRGEKERIIFEVAAELHAANQLFDGAPMLPEEIVERRKLMAHSDYIERTQQLPQYGMAVIELPRLCGEMRRLSQKRTMLAAAEKVAASLKHNDPEALAAALGTLVSTELTDKPRATWAQTGQVQIEIAKNIIAGKSDDETRTVRWPYRSMDIDLKPMRRGELIVVGGFASLGKSSLMRQISLSAALADQNVAFVSLEVPAGDLFNLMAASRSRQPWSRLKGLHPRDQDEFLHAGLEIAELPIEVLDDTHSLVGVLAWIRNRHQRRFLDVVVIDYLGIIEECNPTKYQTKASAVGQVAGAFKRLATELGCVVVLGVQINRGPMNDSNRPPRLSDLKDSGDIEAHADRALLLYRPDKNRVTREEQSIHDPLNERSRFYMEIFQEKGRNAGTTFIPMWFAREIATFEIIQP